MSKIAKIAAFGKWKPEPSDSAIHRKAEAIEHFFVTSLVAIHALKDNSKCRVVEQIFGGYEPEYTKALLAVASIQIKDELDNDKAMAENIRRMACEIGKVDWIESDTCRQNKEVLIALELIINELFSKGEDDAYLVKIATDFSTQMGGYFDMVCFSPKAIREAYSRRLLTIDKA